MEDTLSVTVAYLSLSASVVPSGGDVRDPALVEPGPSQIISSLPPGQKVSRLLFSFDRELGIPDSTDQEGNLELGIPDSGYMKIDEELGIPDSVISSRIELMGTPVDSDLELLESGKYYDSTSSVKEVNGPSSLQLRFYVRFRRKSQKILTP